MPALALLAPAALLVAGAAVTAALAGAGLRPGRVPAATAAWLAVLALGVIWVPGHATQELGGRIQLGFGAPLSYRLDALSFAFAAFQLVPVALLLTLQSRSAPAAATAALTAAGAVSIVLAAGFALGALFLGATVVLVMAQLRIERQAGAELFWPWLSGAWLLVAWAAAVLQALAGTSLYSAVPVTAMVPALFALLAVAGLLIAGLVPGRSWTTGLWERPRLEAAGVATALLLPVGLYLILRALQAADGRFPAPWIGPVLSALGVLTALAAAVRGQGASSRRSYLGAVLPMTGGFGLMAAGLGTQLGLDAAITTAAAGALIAALLPLVPDQGRAGALLAAGLAAGIPPGIAFAGRLLDVEAAIESSEPQAMLGVLAAAAWIIGLAGAARAAWLPGLLRSSAGSRRGLAAGLVSGLVLASGVALGPLVMLLAAPAAAEVAHPLTDPVSGSPAAVLTASGGWPALGLAGPLVVLLGLLVLGSRAAWSAVEPVSDPVPEPFFLLPLASAATRLRDRLAGLRLPDEYRSLLDLRGMEVALTRGRPLLWLAALAALALVVTR